MRSLRLMPILGLAVAAVGAMSVPSALASPSLFAKGGSPTCTVTVTSASSSSTTCTGTLNKEFGVHLLANVDVSGVAVFQCADSTGATTSGQPVRADGGSSTPFTPSKKSPAFTTSPAALAPPSATSASQAGCADGSTPVNPTLTTTTVQLVIAATTGPIIYNCTASSPNGLSGTVVFAC